MLQWEDRNVTETFRAAAVRRVDVIALDTSSETVASSRARRTQPQLAGIHALH
jgi:hypothetical protein